jgi:hypothetical protein
MENQVKINNLQIKRATLLNQLEMLSSVSDEFYKSLGKVEAEIYILKRILIRDTKNTLDED